MVKIKTKFLALIFVTLFCFGFGALFSACGSKDDGKIHVVCTVFPQYDWTRQLALGSNNISVDLIVKNGSDLHSYFSGTPSMSDAVKIKTADVLIYCGGESEKTVEDLLAGSNVNKDMKVINLLEILKEENMAVLEDGEEDEFDEHVWLSIKNAKIFVQKITETLKLVDSQNAAVYEQNFVSYNQTLNELDESFDNLKTSAKQKADSQGKTPSIVVADRYPFAYLSKDLGLSHCAAFSGCSAETHASFETIANLANYIDENELTCILILKDSSFLSLAQTVRNRTTNKNQTILELDSMQGTSWQDVLNGQTFVLAMQNNLQVLTSALEYLN